MAKAKTAYVCTDCGAEHPKWQGSCAECGAWNTLSEIVLQPAVKSAGAARGGYAGKAAGASQVMPLTAVALTAEARTLTGIGELDRVLGGGLVGGSVVLVASFHGIILGYSRQIFALAREAYLPAYFAKVHPRFKTPHRAILAGGVVGIAAIYSDELITIGGQTLTANIVTMSVFGAILMYILSMLSLFKLRRAEAGLARPFRAPFYPFFPAFALFGAVVCMATMIYYNWLIFLIFLVFLALGYGYFLMTGGRRAKVSGLAKST